MVLSRETKCIKLKERNKEPMKEKVFAGCVFSLCFCSQNKHFVVVPEPCSEGKKVEDLGCYFCHCLCFWFLQKWQSAIQKRYKQYNIHESRNYINFLQIIRNSTTVIAMIKWMLQSLLYDIACSVTIDFEKLYTFILLAQIEEIRAFEVQNHVNNMHISDVELTLYISY